MQIQWFPGHMHKTRKEFKQILPKMDVLIEILDARLPFSSENPMLASLREHYGDKPCIKILSKADLADPSMTTRWQEYFEQNGIKTLALISSDADNRNKLIDLCRKLVPQKAHSERALQAMIMGIPNVGKSTLINTMVGRNIAKTGNEAAVTRQVQRINLSDDIVLHDTPGVLWPNIENRHSGYRLAVTGAMRDTAMQHDDVAFYAVEYLRIHYPDRLISRYELDQLPDSDIAIMEAIGERRGCLRAGGQVDLDKVSKILINEIRSNQLGPLTFETPEMMEGEKLEVEKIREEKARKKAAKLEKKKKK